MDDPPIELQERPRNRAFMKKVLIVVALLFVNLLNYMDRFTIAGVLSQLQDYFTMNDKEAGMLQTVFIIFYMIGAPICGYLGDRYNRKMIMVTGLSIWIIAVFSSSFVTKNHFWVFLFLRGIVGIGEASYSTVAPTLIADIFAGADRSTVLMIFYFAVPVGSGLGYIGGAYVSLWFGGWQWGVRFTPILGVLCLILLIVFIEEPTRGASEHAHVESSSIRQDLAYLWSIKTYRLNTVAFTCVVFAVGALSWWAPTLITHAYAIQHGEPDVPPSEKANISLIFGLITCFAGIVGVVVGSTVAQAWREGRWGLKATHTADPIVCAVGSLLAMPCLYTCLITAAHHINTAWVLMFIGVTCMCLNWSVNMDMLMYTVVANRRATATAIQTLISHLFGDASSPYVIGNISDMLRGDATTQIDAFFALQKALFLTAFVLIGSGAFYLWASFHVVEDHCNAKRAMGATDEWVDEEADDVETLIHNVRRSSTED
ncbi:unnamed protein product, partial [Mesorhabditis belari]|uniref:Major facilitator superfamily (MFS) profile domain-containing protein n=1 Tax=Mesorhabditis belari TaxID=2138241 RepID=A0AAF3J1R7_9BILA